MDFASCGCRQQFVIQTRRWCVFAALDHSTRYYAMISLNERLAIYSLPSELVSPRGTSMGGPDHITCNMHWSPFVDRQHEHRTLELQTNLIPFQVDPAPYQGTTRWQKVPELRKYEWIGEQSQPSSNLRMRIVTNCRNRYLADLLVHLVVRSDQKSRFISVRKNLFQPEKWLLSDQFSANTLMK